MSTKKIAELATWEFVADIKDRFNQRQGQR
jgi:hypothetical protein